MRAPGPQLALLAMIALWGVSIAAVKALLERGVPPFALLSLRFLLSVAAVLPLLERPWWPAMRRQALPGVATGIALLGGYALQAFGVAEATASIGGFLTGLIVLLIALGGWLLFREPMRRSAVVGIALGLVGVAVLCLGSQDADGPQQSTLRGIALLIGSAASYATHALLISRLSKPDDEVGFVAWQLLVVAAASTALAPWAGGFGDAGRYLTEPLVVVLLLFLGVLATGIAVVVQSRVQPRIPASRVAVLFATQPLFAALAGVLFLGERLGTAEWTGGALIVLGVVVSSRRRAPLPPARAAVPS